jgi:hypothetical protein
MIFPQPSWNCHHQTPSAGDRHPYKQMNQQQQQQQQKNEITQRMLNNNVTGFQQICANVSV